MSKHNMSVSEKRNTVRNIINNQGGRFFTVKFMGVDGKEHSVNGRTGVAAYSNGGRNNASNKDHLVTAFNVQKMAYRNIFLDGVTEIHAENTVYTF
jgi:hypothetical protein